MTGDYPRWMFHRHYDPLMVDNEEAEIALGPGWTRTIQARETVTDHDAEALRGALPQQEKPPLKPKPGDEPDRYDEDEPEEKPEEQPQEHHRTPITRAPPRKKRK